MKNNMNKKQAEKILATVVMGMNLVNAAAPVAALAAAEQPAQPLPKPAGSEAAPLDYALLPQLADIVDRAIFARAQAASNYDGNANVAVMTNGDTQTITAGQNGTVSTMSGGTQHIVSGGTGTVGTMNSGQQNIASGGTGTVSTMNSGVQNIASGGSGTVSTMNDGEQGIESGSGIVSTMKGGYQIIDGGSGTIVTMSGGEQEVRSGGNGTVSTMKGGRQRIQKGCTGTINTMKGGGQIIDGGSGTIVTMSGGSQIIMAGGNGTVIDMHRGEQSINSGSGTISTMSGGTQKIQDGTGTVSTMFGGSQTVDRGGTGTVYTMNGGTQLLDVRETVGTISIMNGGVQLLNESETVGTISIMSGGEQRIAENTTGIVDTMRGGTQTVSSGGTSLDTVLNSGGTVYQHSGGNISNITYSGGVQIIDNITAGYDAMTLGSGGTNVTMGVISGAQMSGTIINSGGEQLVLSGGTAVSTELNGGNMQLASGGIVSGLTMSGGSMELESIDGGSFAINGTLPANNAVIDLIDSRVTRAGTPAYESLTIDKLSGSGNTFIMDTDLASDNNANSDKITITEAEAGTHYVQVKDLSSLNGIEVTGEHKQLLITDNSGKLTFTGKVFNAGGLWDIDPTLTKGDALGLSAKEWYLTKIVRIVNNDTGVLLDAADNSYALWRNTNDSLRSRLGALASGSAQADGIWARTQAGRFSGNGYEGRYNLYQLGFDQQFNRGSIYGGAIDYGDGSGSYQPGSGKDKLRSFSLYGIWTGDSGTYTNVTARAGNFSTDLESYGDNPDKASYKQHAYSISVEYGKRFDLERGLFFEPQAQFTLGRLGSISYTTDRGANGHIDGMNSAIGRIGFVMGQKITGGSDIYLKADLLHEFAGERDLVLTSDAGSTNDILTKHNDYGDTWFELGLGGNVKLSKAGSLYGELTRGFGGDINKKWQLNAGLRFAF